MKQHTLRTNGGTVHVESYEEYFSISWQSLASIELFINVADQLNVRPTAESILYTEEQPRNEQDSFRQNVQRLVSTDATSGVKPPTVQKKEAAPVKDAVYSMIEYESSSETETPVFFRVNTDKESITWRQADDSVVIGYISTTSALDRVTTLYEQTTGEPIDEEKKKEIHTIIASHE